MEAGFCMLMSWLSVNVHICGRVGEKGMFRARQGAERGLKNGAVDPEWVDVCILVQRAITQSKRALINFFNSYH
jgi:hypothetical protein